MVGVTPSKSTSTDIFRTTSNRPWKIKRGMVTLSREATLSKLICSLLQRGLLKKERISSPWEQILFFRVGPFAEGAECVGKRIGSH